MSVFSEMGCRLLAEARYWSDYHRARFRRVRHRQMIFQNVCAFAAFVGRLQKVSLSARHVNVDIMS